MQRSDFFFELPPSLIAQYPAKERAGSRLLCLDRQNGALSDWRFTDLPQFLKPGDLLVFNDTRVIPARLLGRKASGGRVEILIERILDDKRVLAQVHASKPPKTGSLIFLNEEIPLTVIARRDAFFELAFETTEPALHVIEKIGHIPLPPYIHRADETADINRYQTVYARQPGAVAAPTAGLHFDEPLLQRIQSQGIDMAFITLHVGAGTFKPVRVDDLRQHQMHAEYLIVPAAVCAQAQNARRQGGRIIAVGTTTVRALESAAQSGELQPFAGETRLFITPGCSFRVIDALVTNFHLPESTLLMLICAFAGHAQVLAAYRHAIAQSYRFFSYGDAMFIY